MGSNAILYVNGAVAKSFTVPILRGVYRTSNFVGKSNWPDSLNVNAVYDDLKIFNRSLTQSEIQMVSNSYY
jgi:hypothetical protein